MRSAFVTNEEVVACSTKENNEINVKELYLQKHLIFFYHKILVNKSVK